MGISLNSSQLTTSIDSINVADRLHRNTTALSFVGFVSATVRLSKGDIIRAHTNGALDGAGVDTQFIITQVSR